VHEQALDDVGDPQAGGDGQGDHRDELGRVRPTIDPPSTTPVAGSDTIFTKPRGRR
jgi:hypothetical protein